MEIRNKLNQLVNPLYRLPIDELSKSLMVDVRDDRFSFEDLSVLSHPELQEVMLKCVSWIEFINTRISAINAALNDAKTELIKKESEETYKFLQEKNFARGSKSEAQLHLDSNQEILELRKKISNYEVYNDFLKGWVKVLENIHYASKTILTGYNKSYSTM